MVHFEFMKMVFGHFSVHTFLFFIVALFKYYFLAIKHPNCRKCRNLPKKNKTIVFFLIAFCLSIFNAQNEMVYCLRGFIYSENFRIHSRTFSIVLTNHISNPLSQAHLINIHLLKYKLICCLSGRQRTDRKGEKKPTKLLKTLCHICSHIIWPRSMVHCSFVSLFSNEEESLFIVFWHSSDKCGNVWNLRWKLEQVLVHNENYTQEEETLWLFGTSDQNSQNWMKMTIL